jgi:hypothetical protein
MSRAAQVEWASSPRGEVRLGHSICCPDAVGTSARLGSVLVDSQRVMVTDEIVVLWGSVPLLMPPPPLPPIAVLMIRNMA